MNFKTISFIINGILGAAVIALFVLYFSQGRMDNSGTINQGRTAERQTNVQRASATGPTKIVYINYDTLLMNYEMYRDLNQQLQAKQEEMRSDLERESQQFERQVQDFQEKVDKHLITSRDAKQRQLELQQEQERIMNRRDQLSMELAEEEQVMNRKIISSIQNYLKEYNRSHQYNFIISNTFGQPLLYADNALNITQEIIRGLNQQYLNAQR